MMKTYTVLLILLTYVAVPALVGADPFNTYITNKSQKALRATIQTVDTNFVNILVPSNTNAGGSYTACNPAQPHSLSIAIWVEGSRHQNMIAVDCDRSVVGYDSADMNGVDIFLAVYNTLQQKDGSAIATIYPSSP